MTIALLTARGGSIRLPKKNIREFCGIPLLAWSIIQARCTRQIDKVFLTTDNEEIADIGKKYGAEIIFRPVYDNDVSAGYVLKLAVNELEKNEIFFNEIVYMLPTSPLKKPQDLDNLISSFHDIDTINDLGVYAPDRECYIYKNVDNMMDNYEKVYQLIPIIKDKKWNYSKFVGGWGIAKTKYLMDFWSKQGKLDSKIDSELSDFDYHNIEYGYAIEPWQCFETDYIDQFKLCEIIMEQFILKGKGIKAYTNYAESCGNIIDIDDGKQLSLIEKYAGNSKQLGE
jgi:CMP-N-acetylneuraminic acid synthetase